LLEWEMDRTILHPVVWVMGTNVSEEHTASIFRVEVPTLNMKVVVPTKPFVHTYQTGRNHDPEDGNMNLHRKRTSNCIGRTRAEL
jgi:hypothetical protein